MLENAVRICDANFGNIFRWDDDAPGSSLRTTRRLCLPKTAGPCHLVQAKNPIRHMMKANTVIHVDDVAGTER